MWTVQVSVPAVGVLLPVQAQKTDANPNAIFAKDFIAALLSIRPAAKRSIGAQPSRVIRIASVRTRFSAPEVPRQPAGISRPGFRASGR
jgi:hypothetical protein